jgi:hypothetical protein
MLLMEGSHILSIINQLRLLKLLLPGILSAHNNYAATRLSSHDIEQVTLSKKHRNLPFKDYPFHNPA